MSQLSRLQNFKTGLLYLFGWLHLYRTYKSNFFINLLNFTNETVAIGFVLIICTLRQQLTRSKSQLLSPNIICVEYYIFKYFIKQFSSCPNYQDFRISRPASYICVICCTFIERINQIFINLLNFTNETVTMGFVLTICTLR